MVAEAIRRRSLAQAQREGNYYKVLDAFYSLTKYALAILLYASDFYLARDFHSAVVCPHNMLELKFITGIGAVCVCVFM